MSTLFGICHNSSVSGCLTHSRSEQDKNVFADAASNVLFPTHASSLLHSLAQAVSKESSRKDFFISFTSADRAWADWIAWTLQDASYSVIYQPWDFTPGTNFVSEMRKALEYCRRTIAVYSPNYFNSGFSEDEWSAAFADRSLMPVRVRDCEIPKLLKQTVYIDLVNLDELSARIALLNGVLGGYPPGTARPPFPPRERLIRRFPGALPEIWQVPYLRNPHFTGRDLVLRELHETLQSGRPAALTQAISGLGGVGKTQLALEYAYRYASDYCLVWWLRAEEPITLASDYSRLASRLNLPEKDLPGQPDIVAAVREWLTHNSGWLLIFDNVNSPDHCLAYRPRSAAGHILITSRNSDWRRTAEVLLVKQLAPEESHAFLRKRIGREEHDAAEALRDAVGDLPLALGHAAAYIDLTGSDQSAFEVQMAQTA